SAEHPPSERQTARSSRDAPLGALLRCEDADCGVLDAPLAGWARETPLASRRLIRCPCARCSARTNTERLDQIEKASTCQRRSRRDARGAPGGERHARRPAYVLERPKGGRSAQ